MIDWKNLILSPDDTIECAMRVIDHWASRFAMVCSSDGKLQGVLTDGNIRRGLLAHVDLQNPVKQIMFTSPTTVSPKVGAEEALNVLLANDFQYLPIVDDCGTLISLWSYKSMAGKSDLDIPVLFMAGGLGSRLGELTKNCPKPMLRLDGRPILEITLNKFKDHGFHNFFISLNYQAEVIENYFGNGAQWGVSIKYIKETKRLGTAGPLSLLPPLKQPIIVMNGDILTQINPRLLLAQHLVREAEATMVVKSHNVHIPYGVIQRNVDGHVISLEEKPALNIDVSAGINIFSPNTVKEIPHNVFYDITDLFADLLRRKITIHAYKTEAYWLDIGRLEDYQKADYDFKDFFMGNNS